MANTQPVTYSFGLQDEAGVHAPFTVYGLKDPTAAVSTLATDWATIAHLVDAATDAQVIRGRVTLPITPVVGGGAGQVKGAPNAGAEMERTGVFNESLVANPKHYGTALPALLDAAIASGNLIDLTNAHITALVGATGILTAGQVAIATFTPASAQFIALGALVDAFLSFRKHRRQLRALSYEV